MLPQAEPVTPPYRLEPVLHPQVADFLAQEDLMFKTLEGSVAPINFIFPQIFAENYAAFTAALDSQQLQHRVYYTCKPCRAEAFLRVCAQQGAYVDVSSLGELESCLALGIAGEKLSATGPKNEAYLHKAVATGCLIVADSMHELSRLEKERHDTRVMLRLSNPSVNDVFGFSAAEAVQAFGIFKRQKHLHLEGMACHYSGVDENVRLQCIEQAITLTLQAFDAGLAPCAINIGGGYKVNHLKCGKDWGAFKTALKQAVMEEQESISWNNTGLGIKRAAGGTSGQFDFVEHHEALCKEDHLMHIINQPLKALDGVSLADFMRDAMLKLYIEPGRALVDQAGITAAQVNFTRRSSAGDMLVNLKMNHSNLNAHQFKYMAAPTLISKRKIPNAAMEGVLYYGALCFVGDFIQFHKTFPPYMPQEGDVVVFTNTAAYRMDFAESEILGHQTAGKRVVKQTPNGTWEIDA